MAPNHFLHREADQLLLPLVRTLHHKLGFHVGNCPCIKNVHCREYLLVAEYLNPKLPSHHPGQTAQTDLRQPIKSRYPYSLPAEGLLLIYRSGSSVPAILLPDLTIADDLAEALPAPTAATDRLRIPRLTVDVLLQNKKPLRERLEW